MEMCVILASNQALLPMQLIINSYRLHTFFIRILFRRIKRLKFAKF